MKALDIFRGRTTMDVMEALPHDLIKHREIVFCDLHPDRHQAHSAVPLIREVEGVVTAHPHSPLCLRVTYDVTYITLQVVEQILAEAGFHLDNSLLTKLKRALFYYTEETQRVNLGYRCDHCKITRDIFISRYQRLPHGCRDERPQHWRKYL